MSCDDEQKTGVHKAVTNIFHAMVNFKCQLDGTIGCQDIWSNTILRVSVREFRDKIYINL